MYKIVYMAFVLCIVLPLVYTLGTALFMDAQLVDFEQMFGQELLLLLFKSCCIAFAVALLSTCFGTVLGFLLHKTNVRFRDFFKIALLLPLFISPYILAVAWKDFFYLVFANTDCISSPYGVIVVLTTVFTPLSMLIVGSGLAHINSPLEEAGLVMTHFRTVMVKIILPLIKPALVTSFVLVFIFTVSEFSVPAFLGVKVFTTEIFIQFSAFYNHSLALLQSTLLMCICVLLLFAERKNIANAPFLSIGDKGMNTKRYALKKGKWLSVLILVGWFLISVGLPFVLLCVQSFKNGMSDFIQAFGLLLPTFTSSTGLAFLGAVLVVLVGFISAHLASMPSTRNVGKSFDWMLMVVFAIPSTILGISLIKFYNQPVLDCIYSSYAIIVIGYVGKFSFISAKLIGNAIKQIPKSLDEAAHIAGVTSARRVQKILLPLILPTLFAAFVISFIFSLGELGTTIMLYPPGTEIMPIKVFTIMANVPQALTSSMTLIVFSVTSLLIAGFYFMIKPISEKYSYPID